jgi:hypothetical protein
MKRALKLLGYVLVTIYFVADLVFEAVALPLSASIGRLQVLRPLQAWIAGLRPYPALALFSVPVVILEPVKPIGAFLLSQGHVVGGALTIAAGEIVKITLIERLFTLTRDRLMQIPAFAILYRLWIRFHVWVTSSMIWRRVHDQLARMKMVFRRTLGAARERWRLLRWHPETTCVATLVSCDVVTSIDGQETTRHSGDSWAVPARKSMTVRLRGRSHDALLEVFRISKP